MDYTNMSDIPTATPVVEKHDFKYSIASLIGAVATAIGASVFWIKLIIDSFKDILHLERVSANLILICVSLVAVGGIFYAAIGHRIMNKLAVPIYSAESISDPSVCQNIVQRFHSAIDQICNFTDRATRNFQHPSLTPDLIEVFNKILLTMYGTFHTILTRLETIEDKVDANGNAIRLNGNNIHVLEGKVDRLEGKVDRLEGMMNEVVEQLKQINATLAGFGFVVMPSRP